MWTNTGASLQSYPPTKGFDVNSQSAAMRAYFVGGSGWQGFTLLFSSWHFLIGSACMLPPLTPLAAVGLSFVFSAQGCCGACRGLQGFGMMSCFVFNTLHGPINHSESHHAVITFPQHLCKHLSKHLSR